MLSRIKTRVESGTATSKDWAVLEKTSMKGSGPSRWTATSILEEAQKKKDAPYFALEENEEGHLILQRNEHADINPILKQLWKQHWETEKRLQEQERGAKRIMNPAQVKKALQR